jgi:hypothetical protein
MGEIRSFELLKDFYQTVRRYSQDDRTLHGQCCENFKSNMTNIDVPVCSVPFRFNNIIITVTATEMILIRGLYDLVYNMIKSECCHY